MVNLSKNAIMIDRQPLLQHQERALCHKSLVMMGDDVLFFFLLPQETLERRKRVVKEKRKQLADDLNFLNPQKNNYDIQQAKRAKYGLVLPEGDLDFGAPASLQRKLRNGVGKRMNLKEMLYLHRLTKQQTMSHLGLSHLPPGTKAPPSQPQTLGIVKKQ